MSAFFRMLCLLVTLSLMLAPLSHVHAHIGGAGHQHIDVHGGHDHAFEGDVDHEGRHHLDHEGASRDGLDRHEPDHHDADDDPADHGHADHDAVDLEAQAPHHDAAGSHLVLKVAPDLAKLSNNVVKPLPLWLAILCVAVLALLRPGFTTTVRPSSRVRTRPLAPYPNAPPPLRGPPVSI